MNQNILEKVLKFRDDREWKQFHNPKDLAISLSLEAYGDAGFGDGNKQKD